MIEQIALGDTILESTKEVFETMIFMDVEKASDSYIEGEAVLSSITFTGDIEGCMSFCCGVDCAKLIAKNMLGMEPEDEIELSDVSDAMGEVTNMVVGSIKGKVQESLGNMELSIPSVVKGHDLEESMGDGEIRESVTINIQDSCTAVLLFICKKDNKS